MQTRRLTVPLAVGLLALAGVAGCRTSPNVAAYVGDEQVTVAELEAAVDERLADPAVAASAEGRETEYTRLVLDALLRSEVHAAAAERYGVRVDDSDVQARIDQLLAGQDAEAAYAQAATQGVSRPDVFESVREQLLRQQIAEVGGVAEGLSEESLRARYEETRAGLAQVRLGFVTVPDQATADAAVAALAADPSAYAALAAQYPGPTTLPEPQPRSPEQVPEVLADRVAAAAPNTAFSVTVPQVTGVVVVFVGEPLVPSFEEVRPQLEDEARQEADGAATDLLTDVRTDLDIRVNPRFGVLEEGEIVEPRGGVVQILAPDPGGLPAPAGD